MESCFTKDFSDLFFWKESSFSAARLSPSLHFPLHSEVPVCNIGIALLYESKVGSVLDFRRELQVL